VGECDSVAVDSNVHHDGAINTSALQGRTQHCPNPYTKLHDNASSSKSANTRDNRVSWRGRGHTVGGEGVSTRDGGVGGALSSGARALFFFSTTEFGLT